MSKLITLFSLSIIFMGTTGLFYANMPETINELENNTVKVMDNGNRKKSVHYKDVNRAISETNKNRRPLVIVVTGDFCSWCTKQKRELESKQDPMFDYVYVDTLTASKLKIRVPGGIPQLHIITETDRSIRKEGRTLVNPRLGETTVGYKSVEAIKKKIQSQQAPTKKDK